MKKTIKKIEKTKKSTMVYISGNFEYGWIIKKGREIADDIDTRLLVLNIQKKSQWGKRVSKEVNNIFAAAFKYEAEMLMFFSDKPNEIFKDCIERNNVIKIVLGIKDYERMNYIDCLDGKFEEVQIHIIKN